MTKYKVCITGFDAIDIESDNFAVSMNILTFYAGTKPVLTINIKYFVSAKEVK